MPKRTQKAKYRTNSTKDCLNTSRALPSKTRVSRQIAPEGASEFSAKCLSRDFFVVPFLSLNFIGGVKTLVGCRPRSRSQFTANGCAMDLVFFFRKILAPIKIKSALQPPPKPKIPPPKTRNFMDMGFSCRKNAFFQASIKLTHPFPAPELRTKILRTRGFF